MDITYTQRRTHVGEWWVTWHRVRHCIHEECIDWFDKTMTEKILRKWTSGLFSDIVSCYWLLSIVITCEWPSPKRWNLCTNRTTINLSLWQYSLLLSRFFFKKSCHPLLFFSFFVEHRLLLFTRKLLCFSKPSRFQLFGMQIIHMLLFLVWISMDV